MSEKVVGSVAFAILIPICLAAWYGCIIVFGMVIILSVRMSFDVQENGRDYINVCCFVHLRIDMEVKENRF